MPGRTRARARVASDRHPRERLQEAGTRLFHERGFHATSVRDITEACGLTSGSLYNHFESKEDVLYSIIMEAHAALDRNLDAVPADAPPAQRLRGLVEVFVLHHTRLSREATVGDEWRALDEDHRKEVRENRLRVRARFEDVLRAGVASGEFVLPELPDGDPTRIAAMAFLDMAFRVAGWFHAEGPLSDTEFSRFYAELIVRSVLAR
ncbi:TetR/AcrR family transcriptional regulator [Amycolatopsis rhizosphaerae]|uniref:TetR/AcrR family transcriptional regulator n=1 Tax=Amycolatopsis rhizosphaerae TaxID=2053003 RepID=A0A558CIP8_9PSEU|nr:TetR/AcrR family transcriptional regulator [Amycolatopsis rhizosphaerae]